MKQFLLSCVVVLGFSAPALAQLPSTMNGRRIDEVVVVGETAGLTRPEEVGIEPGARLTRQLLRETVLRLLTSGRWRDAQFRVERSRGGGVRLMANLVPRVLLLRVDIVGNEALDDETLSRALGLGEDSELFVEELPGHVEDAESLYHDRGFEQARAFATIRGSDDPTRKLLIVRFDEGEPTRISGIRFDGEPPPRGSEIRSALDLSSGDILDRREIDVRIRAAELRARERGFLRTRLGEPIYQRTEEGVEIVIPAEIGSRFEVRIVGHHPVARPEVEEVLLLGSERLTEGSLVTMRDRCIELYRRFGFHDPEVEVSLHPGDDDNNEILSVAIRPGTPLFVERLLFPGAQHFSSEFLRNQVFSYLQEDLPGSSFLYPVDTETVDSLGYGGSRRARRDVPRPHVADPETVFYPPTYERAIDHIRELYQADGFLNVTVEQPKVRMLDEERAKLVIQVDEGPQALLENIRLHGNDVISDHEILTTSGLSRGQPFSHQGLQEAKARIVTLYQDRGYFYARVEGTARFSSDQSRAEVSLEVVESVEVHVGSIVVEGNNLTEASLILGSLSFEEGDLYRPTVVQASQEQLLALGIFSGVAISPQDAELPAAEKTVVITVSERKPQYVDLGLGFSTGQGVRGHFEYGFRNAFGLGHEFIFRADAAFQVLFLGDPLLEQRFEALSDADRLERTITAEWRIPHFFDRHLQASVNGAINRDNERDFGIERFSLSSRLAWTPLRNLSGSLGAALEQTTVDLFVADSIDEFLETNTNPRLQRLLRVPDGSTTIVATEATVSLDLRDSPFTPTQGFFARTALEYVVSLTADNASGDEDPFFSNFLKWSINTSAYLPLGGDVVLAGQVRYGQVFHLTNDSKTYPNRAFFLGGVDTIRGYLQDALIPQDVAEQVAADIDLGPNDVARAGDTFMLLRGEIRFPIIGAFRGGAFIDLGNLWADPSLVLDTFSLRPTAGLGLRLQTPVGPLAFDYGIILVRRRELNEPFGTFHFSIGLF